jgi:hypothetical protein
MLQLVYNARLLFIFFGVVFLLYFVSGCSAFVKPKESLISVDVPELSYSGRGKGASFALMGTMGSSGVAIGAAIDQGISKNIRQSLADAGYDFKYEFCQKLKQSALNLACGDVSLPLMSKGIVFDAYKLDGDSVIILTLSGNYFLDQENFAFEVADTIEINSVVERPFPTDALIGLIDRLQLLVIDKMASRPEASGN